MLSPKYISPLLIATTLTACVEPPQASVSPAPYTALDASSDLPDTPEDRASDLVTSDLSDLSELIEDMHADMPSDRVDMNSPEDMSTSDASLDMIADAEMRDVPEDSPASVYGTLDCESNEEAATMLYEGVIELGAPFSIETKRLKTFLTSPPVLSISPLTSVTVSSPESCGQHCRRRTFTIGQANTYTLEITNERQSTVLQTCTITF